MGMKPISKFFNGLSSIERGVFIDCTLGQGTQEEVLSRKYYTYVLMRPDGSVFYVGKGQGNRINFHEAETIKGVQSHKCNTIRKVWNEGGEILKQKVAFFENEDDAFHLEILLISFFGLENLTNGTGGGEGATSNRAEPYKKISIELPISLIDFLSTIKPSRTEWIVEAIKEKREREEVK